MQISRAHSAASLYDQIAVMPTDLGVRADAAQLPFPGGIFDAVTALNVLYHLSDPLAAIREAHRVLRAGGHLPASVRRGALIHIGLPPLDPATIAAAWTPTALAQHGHHLTDPTT